MNFIMMQQTLNSIILCLILLNITIILKEISEKNQRRWRVRPDITEENRRIYGAHSTIFKTFQLTNHEQFQRFTRMTPVQFDYLHSLVEEKLTKQTHLREPLPSELKLAAVINYLAHGGSINQQSLLFRIGNSTMYQIIPEVCEVVFEALQVNYINFPSNVNDWKNIADGFYDKWDFPNCLGAIDGKHFDIYAPANSGSTFFSYKKRFTITIMAMCDAFQRFIWFNIGDFGSLNDSGTFQHSDLGTALSNNIIPLPLPSFLPKTTVLCPYTFLCDGGFYLASYLLTPFTRLQNLTDYQRIFNYRHSRARRIIECAFGLLVSKWRVFKSPLALDLSTVEKMIKCTMVLQNFLIDTSEVFPTNDDEEVTNVDENMSNSEESNESGVETRQLLTLYFNSKLGEIPFQRKCAGLEN